MTRAGWLVLSTVGAFGVGSAGCAFDGGAVATEDSRVRQQHSKRIVVHPGVGLVDHPVAVVLDSDPDLAEHVQFEDGADILFTTADGQTRLPYEIESFDPATGALAAWVLVPRIDASSGAELVMHYDDDQTQLLPEPAWPEPFLGVWHMGAQSRLDPIVDSSPGENHGSALGAAFAPEVVPGIAGSARAFDALSPSMVRVGGPASFDFGMGSFTLSMWVNVTTSVGVGDMPWWLGGTSPADAGYNVSLGQGDWTMSLVSGGLVRTASFGDEAGFLGDWAHLVAVVDREGKQLRLYANGLLSSTTDLGLLGELAPGLEATLGQPPAVFNGIIDELRITRGAVAAEAIAAEYANLADPERIRTVGPQLP